jgi:hypothetical protein
MPSYTAYALERHSNVPRSDVPLLDERDPGEMTIEDLIHQDLRFRRAMELAIKKGLERDRRRAACATGRL